MPEGIGYTDPNAKNEELHDRLMVLGRAIDKRAAAKGDAADTAEMMPTEPPAGDAAPTLAPLMETLGLSAERAQEIFDAAQTLDWLKDKSPEELAMHLNENADDMQAVMSVVARKQDAAAETTVEEPPDVTGATV